MPIRLKRGNYLIEARAVGPDLVAEHDARFGLRHFALLGCLSHIPTSTEPDIERVPLTVCSRLAALLQNFAGFVVEVWTRCVDGGDSVVHHPA